MQRRTLSNNRGLGLNEKKVMESFNTTAPKKYVYSIIERDDRHNIWVKIGVGWINRDGSMNLRLDALPLSSKIQIRDAEELKQ
jgi:hypothetical protein